MTTISKFLSDSIDFDRDIAPYRFVQIIAGVGAGKNTWIRTELMQKYKVLFITSRRATVNAELMKTNTLDISTTRIINIDNVQRLKVEDKENYFGRIPNTYSSIITTNSFIELYAKEYYNIDDENTFIWRNFDFIVLDEAHSLATDATFADSPFHTLAFIQRAYSDSVKCNCNTKFIFMTGTPSPIDYILEINKNIVKTLDKREECISIHPNNASILNFNNVLKSSSDYILNHNEYTLVYFANSITNIQNIVNILNKYGVSDEQIAVSFSNTEKLSNFSNIIQRNKIRVEEYLLSNELIPNDIRIFITTTKNKEGININNTNIHYLISESHQRDDLIQMAGRIRNGFDTLVIVSDSTPHHSEASDLLYELNSNCLSGLNKTLSNAKDSTDKLISLVHADNNFRYIRYNYFRKKFILYKSRKYQESRESRYLKIFNMHLSNSYHFYYGVTAFIYNDYAANDEQVHSWFPYEISYNVPSSPYDDVITYLQDISNVKITDKKIKDTIITNINELIHINTELCERSYKEKKYKQTKHINVLLAQFGYKFRESHKSGDAYYFIISKQK